MNFMDTEGEIELHNECDIHRHIALGFAVDLTKATGDTRLDSVIGLANAFYEFLNKKADK